MCLADYNCDIVQLRAFCYAINLFEMILVHGYFGYLGWDD